MEEPQIIRRTRYGSLATFDEKDLISHFLARCGEWGWDEAGFVASTLSEGARVLDAGAFLGTFGLGLALRKRLGFLCSVEANRAVVPLLESNMQRNANCPSVVVEAMVASSNSAPRAGRREVGNLGSTSFAEYAAGNELGEPPRRSITLAELRAEHGDFDLVKLDVEGMEHEILCGDEGHLRRGGATIWLECNEHIKSLKLAELLLSWGLDVHYFAFPSHNPDNFLGEAEPILPWAYEGGLLVAPKTQPHLDLEAMNHRCILRSIGSVADLEEAMWRTPRWLPREFADADAAELAAIAGRALRGQERDTFLATETQGETCLGADTTSSRLRTAEAALAHAATALAQAETALAHAETLAFERLDQLDLERERREFAERRLASATALALARLSEVGVERERVRAVEQQMSQLRTERSLLAQQLAKAYHRPWRPIKQHVNYYSLTALGALAGPLSERVAARFARSAQKRSPGRFDKFLSEASERASPSADPGAIEP